MIDKEMRSMDEAIDGIAEGDVVLVGGFGDNGEPVALLDALAARRIKNLTIVANGAGTGDRGISALLSAGCVRKLICSYPRSTGSVVFEELYEKGEIDVEIVPQGTIAERIRAAGAGIPAFYTPTSVSTSLADGKETRKFGGRDFLLEHAIEANVALICADTADRWGNLTYRLSARNFNPIMATAADLTIAQVREVVPLGGIDPEQVVTPSIFVDRIVRA